MKKYLVLFTLCCACSPYSAIIVTEPETCKVVDNILECPDGSQIEIPGPVVPDNEVTLSKTIIEKNSCVQIGPDLYIENIQSGKLFDVYSNPNCADAQGEYCDNVETAFGRSGQLNQSAPGSARVCWVENKQISGVKLENGNIQLYILDFH